MLALSEFVMHAEIIVSDEGRRLIDNCYPPGHTELGWRIQRVGIKLAGIFCHTTIKLQEVNQVLVASNEVQHLLVPPTFTLCYPQSYQQLISSHVSNSAFSVPHYHIFTSQLTDFLLLSNIPTKRQISHFLDTLIIFNFFWGLTNMVRAFSLC